MLKASCSSQPPTVDRRGARRLQAHNGAMSNEDAPEVGSGVGEEFRWLLNPAAMIGLLDFDETVPADARAGRRCACGRFRACSLTGRTGRSCGSARWAAMSFCDSISAARESSSTPAT
jgi:hypothetical protein